MLSALAASPVSAEEGKTFTGFKICSKPTVTISPPAPGGYCLITQSSLKILLGAKDYYTDATVVNKVLNSPVTLRAADKRGSTATGHCTYDYNVRHGHCEFWAGTGRLAGFHANIDVGPFAFPGSGVPLMGTYWFDRDHDENDDNDG